MKTLLLKSFSSFSSTVLQVTSKTTDLRICKSTEPKGEGIHIGEVMEKLQ